ncbi:MAG: glycoside hydrolase family 13 protein [Clostridia bacterium]|nr:glycoside hydrolase family 13 protein [Clostridia bacterium]
MSDFSSYEMKYAEKNGDYLRFSCEISLSNTGLYFYRFEFMTPDGMRYCGLKDGKAQVGEWLSEWQLTVYDENFKTPDWAKNRVMYQIFPDRFRRSNNYMCTKNKNERIIVDDWYALPLPYGRDFFMGNLDGIIKKLSYIKELGADIIYLNPIFESAENHRYSTGDYLKVDEFLGTNEDFLRLCQKAETLGIKIILDGVFSHTGADSKYFNKFLNYDTIGAYQGETSPYYNWYNFYDNGTRYDCWWGFENLPNVNETHPDFLEFITGNDGVLAYWQNLGAKGWRLDVADELPDEFLYALRDRVKKVDENALIIGEVWEDATNKFSYDKRRRYLLGHQLDTVMNYVWKNAIIDYIKTGNGENFAQSILTIEENYPKPSIDCLMNIISTHDTKRILNELGVLNYVTKEDEKDYVLSEEEINRGTEGVFLAMFLLFSLPGNACIYYGDEVGQDGFSDPYSRKTYPYGKENFEILEFVKELAALRKKYPDDFSYLIKEFFVSGGALIFRRGDLLFAINVSENDEYVTVSGDFVIICNKNNVEIVNKKLIIPKMSCAVLLQKSR